MLLHCNEKTFLVQVCDCMLLNYVCDMHWLVKTRLLDCLFVCLLVVLFSCLFGCLLMFGKEFVLLFGTGILHAVAVVLFA